MRTDYIPSKENLFDTWQLALMETVEKHRIGDQVPEPPAWSWISVTELSTLKELVTDLHELIVRAQEEKAAAVYELKNERKKLVIAQLREFIKKNLSEELIGGSGRVECGLPVRDTQPTPHPVPADGPESTALISMEAPGVVRIRYRGSKPAGVIACEIRYGIAEAAPADVESLSGADSFTHNPWMHTFSADRAKKLFYALRWRVSGGAASPWSDIKEAVVP